MDLKSRPLLVSRSQEGPFVSVSMISVFISLSAVWAYGESILKLTIGESWD